MVIHKLCEFIMKLKSLMFIDFWDQDGKENIWGQIYIYEHNINCEKNVLKYVNKLLTFVINWH